MEFKTKKYSLVVPIYKDAYFADKFCLEVKAVFENLVHTEKISSYLELIFVSDGGGIKDENIIESLCKKYTFVNAIFLSRNFGQHIAISAGFDVSKGDYIIMTNVDQQEPVSQIPIFLNFIENNNVDIVYGLRKKRSGPFLEKVSSHLFARFFNFLIKGDSHLLKNLATTRVMTRKYINSYALLTEKDRYLPGLENWIGFDRGYVNIEHFNRNLGKSSYNLRKRLKMAFNAVLTFSDYPLKIIVFIGFLISLFGFVFVLKIVYDVLNNVDYQIGYPSILSSIILFSGLIILLIGISSIYIGKILLESKRRPLYIVKKSIVND